MNDVVTANTLNIRSFIVGALRNPQASIGPRVGWSHQADSEHRLEGVLCLRGRGLWSRYAAEGNLEFDLCYASRD
jgi:hypothetical protein